jgi:hypothetical protein
MGHGLLSQTMDGYVAQNPEPMRSSPRLTDLLTMWLTPTRRAAIAAPTADPRIPSAEMEASSADTVRTWTAERNARPPPSTGDCAVADLRRRSGQRLRTLCGHRLPDPLERGIME